MLTRTVALINLSQFLRLPASKKIIAERCTRIRASAGHWFLHRDLLLAPFMVVPRYYTRRLRTYLSWQINIVPTSWFVPRSLQLRIKILPWRQKLRHGSLPYGLRQWLILTMFLHTAFGRLTAVYSCYRRAVSCKDVCLNDNDQWPKSMPWLRWR